MRSRWYKVFIAAAAVVVFITTYMLILPAITLDAKCGQKEHTHSEECYKDVTSLTCQQEESSGHTHTEECYRTWEELTCGQEESQDHIHDASCYTTRTELICGQEESQGHTHTENCYSTEKKISCDTEEHTHKESCYHEKSDPTADVEDEAIWKQTFADVQLTGNWRQDIVAIAKTQVGYKESEKNFVYDEEDEKDGYTRYGAWYGDTYGEWCAMFSSFCIHYAGVGYDQNGQAYPLESNCTSWINKLQLLGYYHEAATTICMDETERESYSGDMYTLEPGDLIFFNLKESQYVVSDHVGIVTEVSDNKIKTIEGNSNGSVVEKTYNTGDPTIIGFGEIPENPNYTDPDKLEETDEIAENETEIEEIQTQREFRYEDDQYIVTAVLSEEAEMPEGAEFVVVKRDETSEEYLRAEEKIKEYVETGDTLLTGMILYDMHFQLEGQEIEPNGSVQVTVQYKEAVEIQNDAALLEQDAASDSSTETEEISEELKVLHLVEEGKQLTVEDVTENIATDQNNAVTEAVFTTDSFSDIAITKITTKTTTEGNWISPGASTNFRTVLGDAIYYGMTLNTFNKTGHVDSTFATKLLNGSGDATTGAYTNDKAGAIWIGEMTGSLQIHGLPTEVFCPPEFLKENGGGLDLTNGPYNTPVTSEAAISYVDSLRQYCISQSEYLAAQPTTTLDGDFIQSKTIDLRNLPAGTYYLDGDCFFKQKYDMVIYMNSNQNIVFNFESKTPQITQFVAVIDGVRYDSANTSDSVEPLATRVIYNCPNATTLTQQGSFAGVCLAPYATYTIGSTSSGWIVCDTLSSDSGEWHFIYQELPDKIPTSAGLKAYKKVNDQTPGADEIFNFYLDELVAGNWTNLQTKQNVGSSIIFDEISYSENGTHWYLVREDQTEIEGVTLSTDQYIYKVEVTSVTTDKKTKFISTVSQYKVDPAQQLVVGGVINENALISLSSGSDVLFNNYKDETTEIEVEKKWKNADGSDLDPGTLEFDASVTVDLYKITDGEGAGEKINEEPILLNSSNNWKYSLDNLVKKATIDGVTHSYSYYFVETKVEGYKTSYKAEPDGESSTAEAVEDPSTIPISGGTFTVINTKELKSEVTVTKKWFMNSDGEIKEIDHKGSISFNLYRVAVKGDDPEPGPTPGGDITINISPSYDAGSVTKSFTARSGATVSITVTYEGCNGWTPGFSAKIGGDTLSVSTSDHYWNSDGKSCVDYSFSFVPTGDTQVLFTIGGDANSLKNWTMTTNLVADNSGIDTQADSSPVITSDGIPEDAQKLNDEPLMIFADNNWTWKGSFDAEVGKTYKYYVEEISAGDWEISYEGQGTDHLTIKNTFDGKPYELPNTGGSGTTLFTMLGILLMAAATSLMIFKKHRKEENW